MTLDVPTIAGHTLATMQRRGGLTADRVAVCSCRWRSPLAVSASQAVRFWREHAAGA